MLIKAFALLCAVRIGLWALPFRFLKGAIAVDAISSKRTTLSEEKIIWSVKAASRYMLGTTCLTQAMTARVLLSRHSYDSELRIGVLREGDSIMAHAWLEKNGRILIGGPIHDYKPLLIEES